MKTFILTKAERRMLIAAVYDPEVMKTSSYRSLKSRCKANFNKLLRDVCLVSQCAGRDGELTISLFAQVDRTDL